MNQLQVIFLTRQVPATNPDNRYRCLVTLIRADRPRHWSFKCHNCGSKIADIMNQEIVSIDDFFDPQNPNNHGIGRHCKGTISNGLPCPYSYYFQLS